MAEKLEEVKAIPASGHIKTKREKLYKILAIILAIVLIIVVISLFSVAAQQYSMVIVMLIVIGIFIYAARSRKKGTMDMFDIADRVAERIYKKTGIIFNTADSINYPGKLNATVWPVSDTVSLVYFRDEGGSFFYDPGVGPFGHEALPLDNYRNKIEMSKAMEMFGADEKAQAQLRELWQRFGLEGGM